jgi:hypothetical protein
MKRSTVRSFGGSTLLPNDRTVELPNQAEKSDSEKR